MLNLANAIVLEVGYQRECARERYLWLRRTTVKPLILPSRTDYAKNLIP